MRVEPKVPTGDLKPDESELRGSWVRHGCRTIADSVSLRIEWLRAERLLRLAADPSAWNSLYRDPRDNRLWEVVHENAAWHGGGPPTLRLIDRESARTKYGSVVA